MSNNTMPDLITITTPAGREIEIYRLIGAKPVFDGDSVIPSSMFHAAVGYALMTLGTDDDDELISGKRIYRECTLQGDSLYLGNFDGYDVLGVSPDINHPHFYNLRSVDFVESYIGPRCVLQVWDEDADTFAYYDW